MAIGDVFKVTLQLALDAVQCRPGFYLVEGGAAPNSGDPVTDCAETVEAALGATPFTGLVENLTLAAIQVEDVQPAVAATVVLGTSAIAGTIVDANPPPPQDSMLISMRTGLRRTAGNFATHGRMYMPGIYSTGQISGFLTPTLKTAFDVFAALLGSPFVEDGSAYEMHIVSFTPATVPRTIRALNPVTSLVTSNQVAIQRRRRPGTGI